MMNQQKQPEQKASNIQIPSAPAVPEHQTCGFILAIFSLILNLVLALIRTGTILLLVSQSQYSHRYTVLGVISMSSLALMHVACIYFNSVILLKKDYLAGKPDISKFWPLLLAAFLVIINTAITVSRYGSVLVIVKNFKNAVPLVFTYLVYSQDDFGDSSLLFLKPYVMVLLKESRKTNDED